VNECADVPAVVMPKRSPAARFEVELNPAMAAARAAAAAACSWARREPISIHERPPAAMVIREAAEATAVSYLCTANRYVSKMTASAKVASTCMIGEMGK